MWRRFGAQQQQQPVIGHPTLIDTTVDEGYLETIQEVESIISRQSSVRHPSLLPDLPFRSMQPHHQQSHHDRASSVYSQASFTPSAQDLKTSGGPDGLHRSDTARSEVSAASLRSDPENDAQSSPLVSPMSAHFPQQDVQTRQDHPFRSQLPRRVPPEDKDTQVDRKAPSYRKAAPTVTAEQKQETRWDDFSGEPTDSEAGKPASARPGAVPVEVHYPQLKERTKQILAGLRDRGPAKKQGWANAPAPIDTLEHPAYREPWKGASGRVALVEPVKNTPAARLEPLHVPQRKIPPPLTISNSATRIESPQVNPPDMSSPQGKSPTIRAVASQDSIRPVVPLKLGSNSGSRVVSPVTPMAAVSEYDNSLQSPFKSPQHTFLHPAPGPIPKSMDQEMVESPTENEPLTPTTPTQANLSAHMPRMDSLQPPESEDVSMSRLSWTTYATTEQGSPNQPSFDSPDVPPIPPAHSLLLRKRPLPSYTDPMSYINSGATYSNGSIVLRKPVPAADRNRSASMASSPSLGKSLPQCPPELEASDKITTLEARLDDLSRRKRNINKIKAALADSLRRNAVAYDVRKRKEIENKLKNLDDEMSEVTQEEHEVGLRLHRAQKKRDREENNLEPTSLWIKRVTS